MCIVFIVTQNTIVADRMEKGETDTFRYFNSETVDCTSFSIFFVLFFIFF